MNSNSVISMYWHKGGYLVTTHPEMGDLREHTEYMIGLGFESALAKIESIITECVMVREFEGEVRKYKMQGDPENMGEMVMQMHAPPEENLCPNGHGTMALSKHKDGLWYCPHCKMRKNQRGYFNAK